MSWEGKLYEIHHEQAGESITLVVDPHKHVAVRAETAFGDRLNIAVLDPKANLNRKRQRPHAEFSPKQPSSWGSNC